MQQLSALRSRLFSQKNRDLPPFVTRSPWISSYEAKILFVKNGKYKISMYEDPKPHDYRQVKYLAPILTKKTCRNGEDASGSVKEATRCQSHSPEIKKTQQFLPQLGSNFDRDLSKSPIICQKRFLQGTLMRTVQYEANLPNFMTSYSRDPLNLKLKSQNLNIGPGLEPLKGRQKNSGRRFLTYKPCENKWHTWLLLPKNPWPSKSASFTELQPIQNGAQKKAM